MNKSSAERTGFSNRLQQCLRNSHHSPDSPTELAREFNIRFSGQPITVHAARKWLVGEAIPTQDKMRTLAEWLQVPIEWLRFGGDEQKVQQFDPLNSVRSADLKLMADLRLLDEHHRQIVREFVRIIVRTYRSKADDAGAAASSSPAEATNGTAGDDDAAHVAGEDHNPDTGGKARG